MLIYLDQNKWIELARMCHGKPDAQGKTDAEVTRRVLADFQIVDGIHVITPLSAYHYMETCRQRNAATRYRLGIVMWGFSKGVSLASPKAIMRHELSTALAKQIPEIKPDPLFLLGRGSCHAFDQPPFRPELQKYAALIERSLLTGYRPLGIPPAMFGEGRGRRLFQKQLSTLRHRASALPQKQRDDFLYAQLTADIVDVICELFAKYSVRAEALGDLGRERLRSVIDDMPTRRVDLHLMRQVLKNPEYRAKESDLEDWCGLGTAACYCDVVVCEKHMAAMLRRDGFLTRARIETQLPNTFSKVA